MFRLIIALGIASVLIPEDVTMTFQGTASGNTTETAQQMDVSAYDTLSAAYSVLNDVTGFCERNEEACITGKALALNFAEKARMTLDAISSDAAGGTQPVETDDIVTATVETRSQ